MSPAKQGISLNSSHNLQWVMLIQRVHALSVHYKITAEDVSVVKLLAPTESPCKVPAPVVFKNLCNSFSYTVW